MANTQPANISILRSKSHCDCSLPYVKSPLTPPQCVCWSPDYLTLLYSKASLDYFCDSQANYNELLTLNRLTHGREKSKVHSNQTLFFFGVFNLSFNLSPPLSRQRWRVWWAAPTRHMRYEMWLLTALFLIKITSGCHLERPTELRGKSNNLERRGWDLVIEFANLNLIKEMCKLSKVSIRKLD